jgi:hypothetical protein
LPDEFSPLPFHVEHIVARQHGGGDELSNLAWACPRCNLRKGPNLTAFDPRSGKLAELFHPRKRKWKAHFGETEGWVDGRTPMGRATANLLDLNDPMRVEIRRALAE